MAKGARSCGATSSQSAFTSGSSCRKGFSLNLVSRPGSSTASSSTSGGSADGQGRKTVEPPPAYGKQTSRNAACGFGRGRTIQREGEAFIDNRPATYHAPRAVYSTPRKRPPPAPPP